MQYCSTTKSGNNKVLKFNKAVNLMEATFNYFHSYVDGDYNNVTTDSIYLPISYNSDDNISINDLSHLYIEVINKMSDVFNEFKQDNSRTISFDLDLTIHNNSNCILMILTMGDLNTLKSASTYTSTTTPFDSTDYWYPEAQPVFNQYYDKCGDYVGQCLNSWATNELLKKVLKYNRGNMFNRYFIHYEGHQVLYGDNLF